MNGGKYAIRPLPFRRRPAPAFITLVYANHNNNQFVLYAAQP